MASTLITVPLFLLSFIVSLQVSAKIILEDGYTVVTVVDGYKRNINPHSVLPRPGSSDLVILDSAGSAFYTVQFPISQDSVVRRFSGDGPPGYSDGDVGSAQFNKPRSFAVDFKGNVYVADKNNNVIRKISGAGVTTVAGGLTLKPGSKDGPAQNASFSDDFELSFVPGSCALLVSDHGNRLVRQINLKEEDCTLGSKSGLGAVMIWSLGLGLSCLLGIIIGIVIRPYIIPHEGSRPLLFIVTWKHCLIHLRKQVLIICFAIKSAVARCSSCSFYTLLKKLWSLSLSHLLLMFRINKLLSPRPCHESVSLIDLDAYSCGEVAKSSKYDDQLKDLISFDEGLLDVTKKALNKGYNSHGRSAMFSECHGADNIVQAKMGFPEGPTDKILQQGVCNFGLVKRR